MTDKERNKFTHLVGKLGLLGIAVVAAHLNTIEAHWQQPDEANANYQQFINKFRELKKAVDWIADHMEGGE